MKRIFHYKGTAPSENYDSVLVTNISRDGLMETLNRTNNNGKWIFTSKGKLTSIMNYMEAEREFKKKAIKKSVRFSYEPDFEMPKLIINNIKNDNTKTRFRKRRNEHPPQDGGGEDMEELV